MQILITNISVEEINAAFLRITRQIKNDQAALESKVTNIVSNNKTQVQSIQKYDDTALKAMILACQESIASVKQQVNTNTLNISSNSSKISSLMTYLNNVGVTYDFETNTLTYTDKEGEQHPYLLKDTTYDFSFNVETQTLTIHNNLDVTVNPETGEAVPDHSHDFIQQIVGTQYTFAFSSGKLTITNSLTSASTVLDFDARYYTETEIDSLLRVIRNDISSIKELIPSQASPSNQLADKDFVNSSIETATATFRGTYSSVADLNAYSGPKDKNDYAFVVTNEGGILTYDKYIYVTGSGWQYEYTINSSGFTAAQLAAINSGITCNLVSKITDVSNCRITVYQGTACKGSFTLNQNCNQSICLDLGTTDDHLVNTVCASVNCNRNVALTSVGNGCNGCLLYSGACPFTFNPSTGILRATRFNINDIGYASRYCYYSSCSYTGSRCTAMDIKTFLECFSKCHNLLVGEQLNVKYIWSDALNNIICWGTNSSLSLSGASVRVLNNSYNANLWNDACSGWIDFSVEIQTRTGMSYTFGACKGSSSAVAATVYCNSIRPSRAGTADNATCFNGCTFSQACTAIRNGLITNGSFNGVNGTISGSTLSFNDIDFSHICDAARVSCAASTTSRRIIAAEAINNVGYVARVGLGLCRGTTGWSKAVLSVGCNDEGTCFWDYCFSNNGQITNACIVHTCTLPSPSNTVTYAQIRVDGTGRASAGKTFRLSDYTMDAILNLDSSTNFYTGTSYGITGYSKCSYSCSNCSCFWIRYTNYRPVVICSDSPFTVLCTTTTAPEGATFSAFCKLNVTCTNYTTSATLPLLFGTACNATSGPLSEVYKNTNILGNLCSGRLVSCEYRATNCVIVGATDPAACPTCSNSLIKPGDIQINTRAGLDKVLSLTTENDTSGTNYCNLCFQIGSGNTNRGIAHTKAGTFNWLLYWDSSDLERHNCNVCGALNACFNNLIARSAVCGSWYQTIPLVCCWAMTAGCTYYINIGRYAHSPAQSGKLDLNLNVYGSSAVNNMHIEWTPSGNVSGLNQVSDSIKVDVAHYSCYGIKGFGFVNGGTAWTSPTCLYVQFTAPNTGTYCFRLSRNNIPTGGWTTSMTCQTTAPTFGCFVCSAVDNSTNVFHWMNGKIYAELGCSTNRYLLKCQVNSTVGTSCCYSTLAINTSGCNPMRRLLVVVCSSCAPSYRSNIYINVMKAGCQCRSNITACVVSPDCDALVPYRVSACNNQIYIDFATCQGATLTANIFTGVDYSATGISCAWDGTITLACFNAALFNCSWASQVTINTAEASNATLLTNVASNIITACCIATTSALKWKKNILPFTDSALGILRKTDVVTYNYKSENDNDLSHIGFIADYTPEVLSGKNKDQMRINDTVGVLINAVKELDERTLPWWKKLLKRIKIWH